jgi:hypothetical protein
MGSIPKRRSAMIFPVILLNASDINGSAILIKKLMAESAISKGLATFWLTASAVESASCKLSGLRLVKLLTSIVCEMRGFVCWLNALNPKNGLATNNKAVKEKNILKAFSRCCIIW